MSTRVTSLGGEFVAEVTRNTRVTAVGAEAIASVHDNARLTLAGAEAIASVHDSARITLLGVEYIAQAAPTCIAEFIRDADAATVDAIADADVLLGHASGAFPNGRIPTDTATIEWDESVANQAKASVVDGSIGETQLDETGVVADTYGDSTHIPQITIDANGRVTDVTEVAASGGGGSAPAWVTDDPRTPPATANNADDEFGGTFDPGETALDTTGGRNGGSRTAWGWRNQGTSTVTIDAGDGVLILVPQVNGQIRGVEQAIPAGSWKIRARIVGRLDATISNSVILGMYGVNNANGKLIVCALASISGGVIGLYSSVWNSVSSWSADRKTPSNWDPVRSLVGWLEAEYNGTTLTFRVSPTGEEGTFSKVVAETVATFLGGLTHLGLFGYADGGSPQPIALVCKPWRKVA